MSWYSGQKRKLNINTRKTKELIMGQLCNRQLPPVNIQGEEVERVTKFILLRVIANQSLKWNDHILSVQRKANSRIYFLKRFKIARLQTDHLVLFFKSIILWVLEYASAVSHSWLTQDQSSVLSLELCKKRAMRIIDGAMSYKDACYFAKLVPLGERRRQTAMNIFIKMQDSKRTFTSFAPANTTYFAYTY